MQPRGEVRPPSLNADEKTTLMVFLDYLRDSVAATVTGLSDEQARTPGVPSGTSLLWLVKHLTAGELNWFVWGTPPPSMRWLLVHVIEETARHAGHADILREQIEGSVGR